MNHILDTTTPVVVSASQLHEKPSSFEVSIIIPCLNEAETVALVIHKALGAFAEAKINGEVIVADNGSTDGSQQLAKDAGARVVPIAERGYGAAIRGGVASAHGKYIIMGDADNSYDFGVITPFVEKLRENYDLVMGSRFKGKILPGAMPPLHQYLGNPVLTLIGNILFSTRISDYHCGLRGFNRQAIEKLRLHTSGMEFATELVAKAALNRYRIAEVPIIYYPDGRSRGAHLRTWRDGWRHLSFMMLLSPAWMLLYPALAFLAFGIIGNLVLLPGTFFVGNISFDVHTLLVAAMSVVMGVQLLIFWFTARLYATTQDLLPASPLMQRVQSGFPLSLGLLVGAVLTFLGIFPILQAVNIWASVEFGQLDVQVTMRWLIPGLMLCTVGLQIFFGSFVMSLLNFRTKF